jgi:hypothetical protein
MHVRRSFVISFVFFHIKRCATREVGMFQQFQGMLDPRCMSVIRREWVGSSVRAYNHLLEVAPPLIDHSILYTSGNYNWFVVVFVSLSF